MDSNESRQVKALEQIADNLHSIAVDMAEIKKILKDINENGIYAYNQV